jgi:tetratricopeptide (TPR) repeat protein
MLADAVRSPIDLRRLLILVSAVLSLACVLVATASPAHAIRLRLHQDRIVKLQDTNIKGPNGEELFLGYNRSKSEYVLGIKDNSTSYYELDEEQIKAFQARGLLPSPLPTYVAPPISDTTIYGIAGFLILCALGWAWKFYTKWRRKRALPHFDTAIALHRTGDFDDAIASYTRAIEINRKLAPAYSLRGNAFEARSENGKAVTDYTKAIRLAPKLLKPLIDRAALMERTGQYDLAIADFTRLIKLTRKDRNGYAQRGRVYLRKGEYDRAIKDFNKAIKITPALVDAYRYRGFAYSKKGKDDLARADLAKADAIAGPRAAARHEAAICMPH